MTDSTGEQVTAASILGDSGQPDASGADLQPAPDQRDRRADLLPEEQSVGSADPEAQAEVILEESLERTEVPNAAPDTHLERRHSEDTA